MRAGLDHVHLFASDVAATVGFFRTMFGATVVWDEEAAEATQLFGDVDPVDFPEVHRFNVPEGCHWRDVRETPANVGVVAAISSMMAAASAYPMS